MMQTQQQNIIPITIQEGMVLSSLYEPAPCTIFCSMYESLAYISIDPIGV